MHANCHMSNCSPQTFLQGSSSSSSQAQVISTITKKTKVSPSYAQFGNILSHIYHKNQFFFLSMRQAIHIINCSLMKFIQVNLTYKLSTQLTWSLIKWKTPIWSNKQAESSKCKHLTWYCCVAVTWWLSPTSSNYSQTSVIEQQASIMKVW